MSPKKSAPKSAKSTAPTAKKAKGFTDDEKAAMKNRARELKAEALKADGESAAVAAIAAMQEPDRGMAKRIHAIVKANAPSLAPTTWYGMPAYTKNGKAIFFFQDKAKFKARYATIGFNDNATLDEGELWPISFALKELTPAAEAKITALVKKAAR